MNTTPYANSLFEQPWWLDIVAPGQWREAVVKNGAGETIARMPYVLVGNRIKMPPMTQTLGIWMAPEVKQDYGKQKDAINALFFQLPPCRAIEQHLSPVNDYVLPFRWLGCRMEPRFTYRLTDLSDLDKVYERLHKSTKKNIRRSQNTTVISSEADYELLYHLIEITFQNQNRRPPVSKELIFRIVNSCETAGHGKMFVARDTDGHIQVAAYMVYDDNTAYALMSGSDARYRSSGAKTRVYWEQIQYAARVSRIFDFEGSMVEGIENIVRQFGGVCAPYYVIQKQGLLGEVLSAAKPRVKRLLGYKM